MPLCVSFKERDDGGFGESDVSFVVWKEEKGLSKPIARPLLRL